MGKQIFAASALAVVLAGCAARPQEVAREPTLAPVGAGLTPNLVPHQGPAYPVQPTAFNSLYTDGASLYRDPRAMRRGDVLTVLISINDKATVDNNTDRSLDSEVTNQISPSLSVSSGSGGGGGGATTLTGGSAEAVAALGQPAA